MLRNIGRGTSIQTRKQLYIEILSNIQMYFNANIHLHNIKRSIKYTCTQC